MKVKISRMSFGCPLADLRRSKHSKPRYGAQNDNRNNEFCQDAVSHQGNAAIIIPFPDHNFKPGTQVKPVCCSQKKHQNKQSRLGKQYPPPRNC
ncbi:Uncharacterised protein [Klebsiella pneumoniae]|nr:Uncharacterised protein [Klebsiella pneumoniae]